MRKRELNAPDGDFPCPEKPAPRRGGSEPLVSVRPAVCTVHAAFPERVEYMHTPDSFRKAIRKLHGCDSEHVESVSVHEQFQGRTVWEGTVEVFSLRDHPKAKRCYVWSHAEDGGGERFFAVLELPPVDSALRAVQAAIASDGKLKPWESADGFA